MIIFCFLLLLVCLFYLYSFYFYPWIFFFCLASLDYIFFHIGLSFKIDAFLHLYSLMGRGGGRGVRAVIYLYNFQSIYFPLSFLFTS